MLKTHAFAGLVCVAASLGGGVGVAPVFAAQPGPTPSYPAATPAPPAAREPVALVVGSVRDQTGAVVAAEIVARDAAGAPLGSARTAADGTFALYPSAPPAAFDVTCAHCAPLHVVASNVPLVFVVQRFFALEGGAPNPQDLAALPYHDPAQAVALAPFVVAARGFGVATSALSDRGLGGGVGLVLDNGAPAYDPATLDAGLYAFPPLSLGSADFIAPSRAFEYGAYAGGGTFLLDPLPADRNSQAALEAGDGYAFAGGARAGGFAAVLADARADGLLQQRGDVSFEDPIPGGMLRFVASSASQSADETYDGDDRSRSFLGMSYARISQFATTQFALDMFETHSTYAFGGANDIDASSGSYEASFRVSRPGDVVFSYGALVRHDSEAYGGARYPPAPASYDTENAYLEASHTGPLWFDAGLAAERTGFRTDPYYAKETLLLPSLSTGLNFDNGLQVRVGASESADPAPPFYSGEFSLQRYSLIESALDYDEGKRWRFGATLFDEQGTGLAARSVDGLGFSAAWQISPQVSLRAWTLHDALPVAGGYGSAAAFALSTPATRAVAWLSYQAPAGLRLDVIARRAVDWYGTEEDLDADIVAPLTAGLSLAAGTSRELGKTRAYVGLRWNGP